MKLVLTPQTADFCWILLLCIFSFVVRLKRKNRFRFHFITLGFFLLMLAAFHSHSLWSFSSRVPVFENGPVTRIKNGQAVVLKTGLRLDDRVTSLAMEPPGRLWMSSGNESPAFYSMRTNTSDDVLAPGPVYGLYPETGMWVLTGSGAIHYRDGIVDQRFAFPPSTIPLCALRWNAELYFGTTKGLFRLRDQKMEATILKNRIRQLISSETSLFAVSEDGIWRFQAGRVSRILTTAGSRGNIFGAVVLPGNIYAATDGDGILALQNGQWRSVRFARPGLNMISQGTAVLHQGMACFGTVEGSVVCTAGKSWVRIHIGESPVTALTSDEKQLLAWVDGGLVAISVFDL